MKATGIVRRVDDLGRVVIPKEIRRTLHIREGDPLEIYTEKDGSVIFRKYSPMGELQEYAVQLCEAIYSSSRWPAVITDREAVIAEAGVSGRGLLEKNIASQLDEMMQQRRVYRHEPGGEKLPAVQGESGCPIGIAVPVVCQGDLMGCVVLLMDKTEPKESELLMAKTVADFLSRQMEG